MEMYQVYKVECVEGEPTFRRRSDDDSEYDCGPNVIDQLFDFTILFNDLGYWDSATQLDGWKCDEALVHIRKTLLRLQTEMISPRTMTAEERAYYRFPHWWFGLAEVGAHDTQYTQEHTPHSSRIFLSEMDRKHILMRHLLDLYNEIRTIPAFRSKGGQKLFYCK